MSSTASHLVEVNRGALVGEGTISPAGLYVVGLRCQRIPVSLGQLRVECHLCVPFSPSLDRMWCITESSGAETSGAEAQTPFRIFLQGSEADRHWLLGVCGLPGAVAHLSCVCARDPRASPAASCLTP